MGKVLRGRDGINAAGMRHALTDVRLRGFLETPGYFPRSNFSPFVSNYSKRRNSEKSNIIIVKGVRADPVGSPTFPYGFMAF